MSNNRHIQHLGNIPLKGHEPLYHTVDKFAQALSRMPVKWRRLQYLDISFEEHQRVLVAAHKDMKPIYYINGEWLEWEI